MKLTALTLLLALAPLPLAAQSHSAEPAKAPVPPSKSIQVTFEGKTITFTVGQLLDMPQVTVHVHNAHRNTDETYSGPLLSDVLAAVGLKSTREFQPIILHSGVIATGTDHYFVLYSAAEVEPTFSIGKVIVAVMKSGLPDTEGGLIQLIDTDGAMPARWVHGLADINVISISPTK